MSPDDLLFNHFSAGVCLSGPHGSACDGEHSQLVSVSKTNYVFSSFKSAECGGGRWCVSRYLSAGLPTASYRDPTTLPRTCWPSPSVTCCSTLPFISSWRFVCLVTLRMWEAPGESSRHVWDLWSSQFSVCAQLRSGERIKCLALVCILFTAVVWGFALYFFFQGLSTWQVSHTHTHTNLWDLKRHLDYLFLSSGTENSSWVSWAQQGLHPAIILWRPRHLAFPVLHRYVWILLGIMSHV